jgi:galactosamine-6-phosphate isomerase
MMLKSTENYEEMSSLAGEKMLEVLKEKPHALFCAATGRSPDGAYKYFIKAAAREKVDISKMRIVKLDEWLGVPIDDSSSCEMYIREHIIEPLNIDRSRYVGFDSMTEDPDAECKRLSDWISANGPIDCCILGLGKNGHLGLNEPDEFLTPFCHQQELSEKTKTHSMLQKTTLQVKKGLTLGMTDILNSHKIIMLITGNEKQTAAEELLAGRVTTTCPATFLWLHKNTLCFIDGCTIKAALNI